MDATPNTVIRIRTDRGDPAPPQPEGGATRGPSRPGLARRLEPQRPRDRRSRLVLFGLVWAVLAVGFTVAWITRLPGSSAPEVPDAAPPTAAVAAESPDTDQAPAPGAASGGVPAPAVPAPTPRTVAVGLVATRDDVWVQVSVDGAAAHEGVVRRGDHLDFQGDAVDLVVSKPAAVDVSVDGAPVPPTPKMHLGSPITAVRPGGTTG